MSLQQRMVSSTFWNLFTNVISLIVLFIRFTLLSRWVPKETFGDYATATLIVQGTIVFASWGIGGGFLNRVPETENEQHAADVHFSLRLVLVFIWSFFLLLFSLFLEGDTQIALICLVLVFAGLEILQVPRLILIRRVVHRRLALLDLLSNLVGSAIALILAWFGYTLWALLSAEMVNLVLTFFILCVWYPFWLPKLVWDKQVIKYYLNFGKYNFGNGFLLRILDKLDDVWVRIFLGNTALADYSRAYTLATYPRQLISKAVDEIALGSYAELKNNRPKLAIAFAKTNSLLIRFNLLASGALFIMAPEVIKFLLTDKWLSIIPIFQMMLVFTVLDPIKLTVGLLFLGIGKPIITVWARVWQVFVLVISMFIFGLQLGNLGVAISVNLMILMGLCYLFYYAKKEIEFSIWQLFFNPLVAFGISSSISYAGGQWINQEELLITIIVKGCIYFVTYLAVLFMLEKDTLKEFINIAKKPFQH